ncbi:hypothetical protein BD408DRAFT_482397 [Parasitella parasitica]|nr:hypothetical protein BD408DRAFT_482397 [Parasitella parasitica]
MAIHILLHNLKLLGFDESKHMRRAVELNELLFTRDAVNNDKAFEYICLFLFQRIDRNRVKRDLMPNLTIRTYGSKQNFITKVHQWLIELRRKCPLFNRIPLRKSELLAYHGDNLIKIMVAFSTFVINFTLEQGNYNNLLAFAKSSPTEIQEHIKQIHQSFKLNEESNNTFIDKASEAANDLNAELASPSAPSPPQAPAPLVTTQETRQLNQDLGSIKLQLESMLNADTDNMSTGARLSLANQEGNREDKEKNSTSTIEEETAPSSFLRSRISSFNSADDANSKNLDPLKTTVKSTANPVKLTTRDIATNSAPKHTSIPNIITLTNSIPDTSYKAKEIQHISPSRSLTENTLPSFSSLETSFEKIPNISGITDAVPHSSVPNSSRKLTFGVPNSPLKPVEINTSPSLNTTYKSHKLDVKDFTVASSPVHSRNVSNSVQSTLSNSRSFKTTRAELPVADVTTLAPIQFSYAKEACRLPSFRNCFLANSMKPVVESPYWFLPPIYDFTTEIDTSSMLLTQHFSPAAVKTGTPSAASTPCKRKISTFEESEDEQQLIIAPSPTKSKIAPEEMKTPPRQIVNLEWEDQHEASPHSLENLEMVPPLMEESAPFKRIYQTEFFDIDFLTPRR